MMSSVMMLIHLEEQDAATRLRNGIEQVYLKGEKIPKDVGGTATTDEFTDAVIGEMQ